MPKNRNYEISRFKGLGEMTAQQLKETTHDPKTRILLRVDIESQLEADKTVTELLGIGASERYRLIDRYVVDNRLPLADHGFV